MADKENGSARETKCGKADNDLISLLCSSDRNFVVHNNSDKVGVENLKGKMVGLYFSAFKSRKCQIFTQYLMEVYNELFPKFEFEIVFVSVDEDDESFICSFSKMPWLAIPFSDSKKRDQLKKTFCVKSWGIEIPVLLIFDEQGEVVTYDGVQIIRVFGAQGYPFTLGRFKEIRDEEQIAKRDQSLRYLLVSRSRDFVVASDGEKFPVTELEGKTVGLFFSLSTSHQCIAFAPKLIETYKKLKDMGENFEIVMINVDDDEEAFNPEFKSIPWFSLPIKDIRCRNLARYFQINDRPAVVVIGPDGRTIHSNIAQAIEEHSYEAYPFTHEKFVELEEAEKAKTEAQTLESILVLGDRDFVIGKNRVKIPVVDLVGKNILLYFSSHWFHPCRDFLPKLIKAYHKIKAKDDAFEAIFISSDRDEKSFDEFFSMMPWLAVPFGDERVQSLRRTFKLQGKPLAVVAIGPSGKTITTEAKNLIMYNGADAYPFTDERTKEIEAQFDEIAKGWPKMIEHDLHLQHELVLTKRQFFTCDLCDEEGAVWSFCCGECNYDLHPECAL